MMSQNNHIENIDRYLSGEMTQQEREAFETAMHSNTELAEEVKSQKVIRDLVFDRGILNLKGKLVEVEALEKARLRRNYRWFFYGVVGIAGITAAVISIDFNENEKIEDNGQLVAVEKVIPTEKEISDGSISIREVDEKKSGNQKAEKKTNQVTIENNEIDLKNNFNNIAAASKDTFNESAIQEVKENRSMSSNTFENINTNKRIEIDKSDCRLVSIFANVTSSKTCYNKKEGKIIVDLQSVKGGEAPYSYSINQGSNVNTNGIFTNLAEGKYTLIIKDNNGCTGVINSVEVASQKCVNEQNYSIAPDFDEQWNIPMEESVNGILTVFDQAGRVVIKIQFDKGMPEAWNGTSSSGVILNKGAYYYEIRYDTGNTLTGFISIIR